MSDDPIEKKPLYHFLPGSRCFSVGFYGCNLHCPFCQNWEISQTKDESAPAIEIRALINEALARRSPSIAFTYSEPAVHFEYLVKAMDMARSAGLRTVLVTNGCLSSAPAAELLARTDATNVDLKTWDAGIYREVLGGDLGAVRNFIELAAASCHVEVTTLVAPGIADDHGTIAGIAGFLAGVDKKIPLHLSAYHPAFHASDPPTDAALLLSLAQTAKGRLDYVYVGNLPSLGSDTRCKSCGAVLARRKGYSVQVVGLAQGPNGSLEKARCKACGTPAPFVLA